MMKAASSKSTTRRNIPEDHHLHTRRRENLKSHIIIFVSHKYESYSLILREEYKLKVFENRMPRRIFCPKRVEKNA
jgi:hypothetical protein